MNNQPTVLIIDDNNDTCSALRCLFESIHLNVETWNSPTKFLEDYSPSYQGCVITDVKMPEMSGLELLSELKQRNNALPVIMMTGFGDIPMAVKAMKSGAADFIIKPVNGQYLLEIIQQYLKPAKSVTNDISDKKNPLTKREQEVMDLILDGKLNKQIAADLEISISTVEAHRAKIMHKYNARNLAQLIKTYFQID